MVQVSRSTESTKRLVNCNIFSSSENLAGRPKCRRWKFLFEWPFVGKCALCTDNLPIEMCTQNVHLNVFRVTRRMCPSKLDICRERKVMTRALRVFDLVNWPKWKRWAHMMQPKRCYLDYPIRPVCVYVDRRPTIKRHEPHWYFAFW